MSIKIWIFIVLSMPILVSCGLDLEDDSEFMTLAEGITITPSPEDKGVFGVSIAGPDDIVAIATNALRALGIPKDDSTIVIRGVEGFDRSTDDAGDVVLATTPSDYVPCRIAMHHADDGDPLSNASYSLVLQSGTLRFRYWLPQRKMNDQQTIARFDISLVMVKANLHTLSVTQGWCGQDSGLEIYARDGRPNNISSFSVRATDMIVLY